MKIPPSKNSSFCSACQDILEKSLSIFQSLNNQEGIAWSLYGLARLSLLLADFERASTVGQQALTLLRALGLDEGVGQTLLLLGQVHLRQGEAARAHALFMESLQLFQAGDNCRSVARALYSLACVAVLQGSREEARAIEAAGIPTVSIYIEAFRPDAQLHSLFHQPALAHCS